VTHYMIVCTTEDAVRDLGRNHTVQLGTEVAMAVGPTGMAAGQQIQAPSQKSSPRQQHALDYHSTYAYAISSGLFLGVTLEGSMIRIRHDVNAKFYGQRDLAVGELLQSPGVPAAQALYDALDIATQQVVPEHALFKPSRYLPK
jgi:lipid-binding SYLF domain-containing protein